MNKDVKANAIIENSNAAYRNLIAGIYAAVLFLDRLDLTIVNITLPTLAKYYNVSVTQTEWVTNAFLFALAISIPASSWLADKFGDKYVFITAIALFGLASLCCAFSPTLMMLIFFRFLQGIGGGVIIPVGMSMVYSAFHSSEYASITSYVFLPTLIAPAIAPFLGGVIMAISSWHWVFIFAAPICLVAVVLSAIFMSRSKVETIKQFDFLGFLTFSSSLILLLYAISLLGKTGISPLMLMVSISAFILAMLFLKQEKAIEHPLFEMDFFRNKFFMQVNIIQVCFQMCHFGSIFLIGLYLQLGVGMSATISGLIMGAQAIGAMTTNRLSVAFYNRYGASLPIIIGFFGILLFTAFILFVREKHLVVLGVFILFMRGVFSGLCGIPLQTSSIIGFDKSEISRASALFNAGRQVSISLGVSVSAVFIAYGLHHQAYSYATPLSVFYPAFMAQAVIAVLGIYVTSRLNEKER